MENIDRGQLISVGAFVIAILLVILASTLNSVIFIQNLDSRADTVGRVNPINYEQDTTQAHESLLNATNNQSYTTYADLEKAYKEGSVAISNSLTVEYTATGHGTNTTVDSTTKGVILEQQSEGMFIDPNGMIGDWTMISGVNQSSKAHVQVRRDSLVNIAMSPFVRANSLTFEFSSSSGTWKTSLYRENSDVYLNSTGPGVSNSGVCAESFGTNRLIDVNFQNQSFSGQPCSQLSFYDDLQGSDYSITVMPADVTTMGLYEFIVEADIADADSGYDTTKPYGDEYAKPILYSATYSYYYYDSEIIYEQTRKVVYK